MFYRILRRSWSYVKHLLQSWAKGLVIMYISFLENLVRGFTAGMFSRKCSLRNLLRFYSEGNIIRSFWSFIKRFLVSVLGSSLAYLVPSGGPVWLRALYPKIIWLPKWSETGTFWSHLAAFCGCVTSARPCPAFNFQSCVAVCPLPEDHLAS